MRLSDWFPPPQKMSDAVQLRASGFSGITMRQSLGMVVFCGFLAGLVPFMVSWQQAASAGSALPLARVAAQASQLDRMLSEDGSLFAVKSLIAPSNQALMADLTLMLAGLDQPFPGWLAAFLSALGEWINWPLRWVTVWIVYGAMVMVCNKAFGAAVRLQPFFAATGFAAVPLLLIGLAPVQCLGGVSSAVGAIWSAIVYARANEQATALTRGRSLAAVLLPLTLILFISLLVLGLSLLFAVQLAARS